MGILKNGNEQHKLTREENSRGGKKGGKILQEQRKERKRIAQALREVLDEQTPEGLSRLEVIATKVLKKLYDEGDIRDLKILTEILGEDVKHIEVSSPAIIVKDDADAKMVAEIMNNEE